MRYYIYLLRTGLLVSAFMYVGIMLSWYNRFAYETSSATSPIGSDRQEELYQADIAMAQSRAGIGKKLREGREATLVDQIGIVSTEAQKKSSRQWEKAAPFRSTQADDVVRTLQTQEQIESALYGSKRQ